MKCRFLHETHVLPSEEFPGAWRCRACGANGAGPPLKRCPECNSPVGQRSGRAPAGTVLEFPKAFRHVQMGAAVPADEECAKAVGMEPEQLAATQKVYEKVRLGIAPEDYQAYDDGLMVGYKPDGTWEPGENYEKAAWKQRKAESPLVIIEDE